MKRKTTTILGVLSALLLLTVTAVYAHAESQENVENEQLSDRIMKSLKYVDEMHDLMTEGLNPQLKEQMDIMHQGCTSQFKEQSNNKAYMNKDNTVTGRTFNGMMGVEGMMG